MGRSGGGATGETRATAPAAATGKPVESGPVGVVPAAAIAAPGVHAPGVTAPAAPTVPLLVSPDAAKLKTWVVLIHSMNKGNGVECL